MAQAGSGHVSAAELEMYIAGIQFPADKDAIIGHITHEGAPSNIIDLISGVPNKTYESVADLAVGTTLNRH